MQRVFIVLLVSLALSACNNQDSATSEPQSQSVNTSENGDAITSKSESEKLNEWFEAQYEEELMRSPIGLTFQGRKERYGEIDDMSEAAEAEQLEWKRKSVEAMKAMFDYDKLNDDAKISYDLWAYQYERAAAGVPFKRTGYIFEQMNGTHAFFPTLMMSFHPVASESEMQAYVSRLSAIGRAMDQLIERAKLGVQEGVRPPRFAYEIVHKEASEIISGKPFDESENDSSLWNDAKTKAADLVSKEIITQERSDELLEQTKQALVNDMAPAYKNLLDFIDGDMANTTAEAQGVHALPNGEAYYNYRLKQMTTTDMTADEIHDLGLAEVERIRGEMEAIKNQVGFEGDLQAFFTYIRDSKDNEQFYYPNTDEGRQAYIDDATAAIDNIRKELPNYFGILPKGELVVKRVEPFREQDGAPQHYYPGTPDGARPGIYYAHLSDMSTMPKNELEVIAYHEGLPGHHMQIAIAQELTGVPKFRTQAGFTAYAEGWGLYSEALAKEMNNTFTDPYSDFGRLGSEMWRAIRLVVDTGLHEKKWSQQQAIDFFAANSPAPQGTIEAEIRRYLVIGGQATAYKVGMIEIQRLRKKAEDALGDDFDIRDFHDTVLGGGSMPLSLLARRVDSWIDASKAAN